MNRLIEAAARAACELDKLDPEEVIHEQTGPGDWEPIGPLWMVHYQPTAQAAILAFLEAALEDEGVVKQGATSIAHAMFADGSGDKSPTIAGYFRASRAALRALIQQVKSAAPATGLEDSEAP